MHVNFPKSETQKLLISQMFYVVEKVKMLDKTE